MPILYICYSVQKNNKGRTYSEKVKRVVLSNSYSDSKVPTKKSRISEVQSLNTDGYQVKGGRLHTHLPTAPIDFTPLETRVACPTSNLSEDIYFDQKAFNDHAKLVLNYTEVAKSTVQVSKAKDRASYMLLWTEGLYVSTKYLFVYLPDDVIDEKIVSVKK